MKQLQTLKESQRPKPLQPVVKNKPAIKPGDWKVPKYTRPLFLPGLPGHNA